MIKVLLIALNLFCTAADAGSIRETDLVGAWLYVSSYIQMPDGRKVEQFGANPQGIFVILPNGIYSHIIMENDLPKYSSGKIKEPTAEEAMRLAVGSLSHFGTYRVDAKAGIFIA